MLFIPVLGGLKTHNYLSPLTKSQPAIATTLIHTWAPYRERIRAVLHLNGVVPALIMLDELIAGPEARAKRANIEARYLDWSDLLSSENDAAGPVWQHDLQRIIEDTEELLDQLEELREEDMDVRRSEGFYLRKSWANYFHHLSLAFGEKSNHYRDETVFALVSRVERVHLPTTLIDRADQRAYKRAFYRLQDLYHASEFAEAYIQGLRIRDELECESAQLYEYLLLALFQKEGATKIIDAAVDRADYLLMRQLYVYAERLQALQWPGAPQRRQERHPAYALTADGSYSYTAIHNLRQIANGLLLRLTQRYAQLVSEPDSAAARLALQRAMWLTGLLGNFTKGDALFAPLVITELAGGGPHTTPWIEIDETGELHNRYPDFDALALLRASRRVARFEILPAARRPEASLVADLLTSQQERYRSIQNERMLDRSESVVQHQLRNWLENAFLLRHLFPNYPELAYLPIQEMASQTGLVDWFGIDEKGDLIPKPEDPVLRNFPAYHFLRTFVLWAEGEIAWAKRESELRELAYYRTAARANARYAEIQTYGYPISERNHDQVVMAIECLQDWLKCYRAYGEINFWEDAYREITGQAKFCWFQLSADGFVDPILLKVEGWSSKKFLSDLLRVRTERAPLTAQTEIAINYLRRFLRVRHDEIREITKNQLNPDIAYRQEVYNLMEHALVLCETIVPLDELLDFVYDELIGEDILPWLDVKDGRVFDYAGRRYHPVPAAALLERVRRVLPEPEDRWSYAAVRANIMERRFSDLRYDYTHDFSAIRYRNSRVQDRKLMFDLLAQCLHFYELTDDPAYLVLPYREFIAGLGRVRWAYYLRPFRKGKASEQLVPFFLFEHWHNWRIDGLRYNALRRYLKTEWRKHQLAGNLSNDQLLR